MVWRYRRYAQGSLHKSLSTAGCQHAAVLMAAESPRETDQTFITAREELEAMPTPLEQDQAEVSSPVNPGSKHRAYKRHVEQLKEEAMGFLKKSKTLAVEPNLQEDAGLVSGKTRRATQRAARAQQREMRKAADTLQDTEASQALLHLAQGQIEPAAFHDDAPAGADLSWEGSQSTSSDKDKMFAAAWAATAGPARLAADWRSGAAAPDQPASISDAVATGQEAATGQAASTAHQPAAQLADQAVASPLHTSSKYRAQAAQSPQPASGPLTAVPAEHQPEVPSPAQGPSKPTASSQSARSDHKHAAAEAKVKPDVASSPSPRRYVKPVTRAQSKTPQSGQRVVLLPRALLQSPAGAHKSASTSPAGHEGKAGSPKQSDKPAPATSKKAAGPAKRSPFDPAQASTQGDSTAARPSEQEQSTALEERALQLATQRLMDEESRQKQADEALLRSTPSAQLLQVPIWSNSLAAGQGGARLEGTLVIPKDCSVRLMRRVFARAAQIQPWCVEFLLPSSKEVVQDFEAGQEVFVARYRLQEQAGGLQVQLRLEQGCAQVQALIDREVSLVKHQLLAARLTTPPAGSPAGPSGQPASPARQFATAAVLESHGWGATSPAKRVTPGQKPAQAASRHMAEYEAMLPAQQQSPATRTVPMVSPARRKIGRWDEAEVETLIQKMEAGYTWARLRDEWPTLGFVDRSAVDIKDKWRNLEDAVLKGKVMRHVRLSSDQRDRILRCHRKYRSMLAAVPDQSGSHQAGPKASENGQSKSPVTEQEQENE